MKPKEERKLSTLRGMTIIFRPELCVLCRSCELACAVSKSKSKNLFTAINEKPIPQQRLYITKTADEGIVSHNVVNTAKLLLALQHAVLGQLNETQFL